MSCRAICDECKNYAKGDEYIADDDGAKYFLCEDCVIGERIPPTVRSSENLSIFSKGSMSMNNVQALVAVIAQACYMSLLEKDIELSSIEEGSAEFLATESEYYKNLENINSYEKAGFFPSSL